MHKSDSADFSNRVKVLLDLMTNNSTKEWANCETEDYFISSDESDIETEDNDESNEDEQNFGKSQDCDTIFHLNKFYEDHAQTTRKHLPTGARDASIAFDFEDKMYRVIPLRLDKDIFKFLQYKWKTAW
ncbi:PREDICTED: uncharacterized protein LOC108548356 [Eufriesea mexicana]|uniref:uncharacterized protein LOC108548356 n=1 Tax=Eufriesea mexicana TaxID=516756 RepID=UPI00083C59D9|nr:PREDICTED: uncharacterized protein LOC108548356 [Eufriesea mexicana]